VLHHPDDDPLGGFGLPKPHGLSDFVEGLARWHNRVIGYAVTLVTDSYPRFRLAPRARAVTAYAHGMEQPGLGDRLPFRGPRLRCGQFGVFRGPGDRPQHRYCVCRAGQAQRQCQGARRRGE